MNHVQKIIRSSFIGLAILAGLSACQSARTGKNADGTIKDMPLQRDEAMIRSKQIQDTQYRLWFEFNDEDGSFTGRVNARFELKAGYQMYGQLPFLDFQKGKIKSLRVNNKDITDLDSVYDGNRIHLPKSALQVGVNEVSIQYEHEYSKIGLGLYRFKDPADGRVYVYTNLEPYMANSVFPCFDQPDLKATYEITVSAPPAWHIIANTMESKTSKIDGKKVWEFPKSEIFSTYVFALIGGEFKEWKSSVKTEHGTIPLRLFARQSVAKLVPHQRYFEATQKGFEFYPEYFQTPYPYGKYDQILVPNFTAGAMENVAAVTFNERFLERSPPTLRDRINLADTVLHEMVHMWFGDWVTMRWWNGLWLNEAFATHFAHFGLIKTKLFKESDVVGVSLNSVSRGLHADSMPTTHPIEGSVLDTSQAFSNFDAITYLKGSAAIGLLHKTVGEDQMSEGLFRYFTKYARKNTVLAEFIQSIQQASDISIEDYADEWLKRVGSNLIQGQWECAAPLNGPLQIHISQSVPKENLGPDTEGNSKIANTIRSHNLEILSVYSTPKTRFEFEKRRVQIHETQKSFELTSKQKKCPEAIFLNADYGTYSRTSIDSKSLQFVKDHLNQLEDSTLREYVWITLWQMLELKMLDMSEYLSIVEKNIVRESSTVALRYTLSKLSSSSSRSFVSVIDTLSGTEREAFIQKWAGISKKQAESTKADQQKLWVDFWLSLTAEKDAVESIVKGKSPFKGYFIGPAEKWNAALVMARLSADWKLPEKLLTESDKEFTRLHELFFKTIQTKPENLAAALNAIEAEPDLFETFYELYDVRQPEKNTAMKDYFISRYSSFEAKDEEIFVEWIQEGTPKLCSKEWGDTLLKYSKSAEKLSAKRALLSLSAREAQCVSFKASPTGQ